MSRILLCDDSALILKILEKRLQEVGLKVIGKAKDGDECLKLYSELKPALVLLDITMPNKDGRECLRDLMIMDPQANVIMLSALVDKAVQAECLALGAKAFIGKTDINSDDNFKNNVLSVIMPLLKPFLEAV